jgi:hypothetical protein
MSARTHQGASIAQGRIHTMARKTNQDRSFGEIAKSALGGLTQFGVETGRLAGKGAKAAWGGARRIGGKARVKASETASELKEKASETASELKEKASETASELKDKASELKEKRASANIE